MWRCACPGTRTSRSTGRTWWPTCTGCSTGWARWLGHPFRPVDGGHRKADHHRGQHRDRGLRPGPGHVLCGVARLRLTRRRVPVRVQHRPGRPVRRDRGSRPGRDPLRGQLQDVHHPGDPDQRQSGATVAARRDRDRRGRRRPPLRGGVHQRGRGQGVRHRPGQHVRLLGLGGWALLLRFGHRVLPDGGHRPRGVRRHAGRFPRHRPTLRHRSPRGQHAGHPGDAQRLVQQPLRGRRPTPCSPTANACPAFPPISSS